MIQELLQEIFSEELVQRYGSSYLRIMWVRILNMIFQYFDGKGSKTISAEELLSNFNLPEHMQSLAEDWAENIGNPHGPHENGRGIGGQSQKQNSDGSALYP